MANRNRHSGMDYVLTRTVLARDSVRREVLGTFTRHEKARKAMQDDMADTSGGLDGAVLYEGFMQARMAAGDGRSVRWRISFADTSADRPARPYTVKVTVPLTLTVKVKAGDADEAESMALARALEAAAADWTPVLAQAETDTEEDREEE